MIAAIKSGREIRLAKLKKHGGKWTTCGGAFTVADEKIIQLADLTDAQKEMIGKWYAESGKREIEAEIGKHPELKSNRAAWLETLKAQDFESVVKSFEKDTEYIL